LSFGSLGYDAAHLLESLVLLMSFALLYQRRLPSLLTVFTFQALALGAVAAWLGWVRDEPHLYLTALLAWGLKAGVIPWFLRRAMRDLGVHRTVEPAFSVGATMLIGLALVTLSVILVAPAAAGSGAMSREELALSLSVVLLGFLMMIARRNAVSQIVGFMSIENGLILGALGANGMPMIVELMTAFSVLVAFIVFGIFMFRIRERFETLDVGKLDAFRGERR